MDRSSSGGVLQELFRLLLFAPLLLAIAAACGHTSRRTGATTPGIPLGSAPATVVDFCAVRARLGEFPTLCPARYPRERNSSVETSGRVLHARSYYFASFNDPTGFPQADDGHVVIGAQERPFLLNGSPGQLWPPKGVLGGPILQLPIPRLRTTPMQGGGIYTSERPSQVIERSIVERHPALVLKAPAYPAGGLSGGHIIVVWNAYGHGYFVSLHLNDDPHGRRYSQSQRIEAALELARSCKRIA